MSAQPIAICLILLLVGSGLANAQRPGEGDVVEFETLELGTRFSSGFDAPQDFVIRNARQWCRFWGVVHAGVSPPPPCDPSAIDFRREVVLASALGPRPNDCYAVSIRSITRARGPRRLQVLVEESRLGVRRLCRQAFVWPVTAVVVSKPVGRVEFVHRQLARASGAGPILRTE